MASKTPSSPHSELAAFRQDFQNNMSSFQENLRDFLSFWSDPHPGESPPESLPVLHDVDHRLRTLLEKIANQHAYVILFGPLKSGKSTLMNAISASYVSEVSSLPAYPCLVYVRDEETQQFEVTRYGGKRHQLGSARDMTRLIEAEHMRLAEKIRAVEEEGEFFDPARHFPEAIRRVDVATPAPELRDSMTVLVDTPGLYSRMKFGYDLMTREFRDSAACAVFVVKTDNLFLEQVFAEFNELLCLFSRIFLVVNIDSRKLDLGPDGSLVPSLEATDPEKILHAFEYLAMSAPLRRAYEEGRLRLYPIDLLNAASDRLTTNKMAQNTGGEETVPVTDDSSFETSETGVHEVDEEAPAQPAHSSFQLFLNDLTDYLNSTDYLTEFRRDCLRQGRRLAAEVALSLGPEQLTRDETLIESVRHQIREVEDRRAAALLLQSLDWERAFADVRTRLEGEMAASSRQALHQLEEVVKTKVAAWFGTEASLAELRDNHCREPLDTALAALQTEARSILEQSLSGSSAGMVLPLDSARAFDRMGLNLEALRDSVWQDVLSQAAARPNMDTGLDIPVDSIPVRKGFWDWVLFWRGQSARRRALFGKDSLDKKIPVAVKERQLQDTARERILEIFLGHLQDCLPKLVLQFADSLLDEYTGRIRTEAMAQIEKVEARAADELPALETRLDWLEAHLQRCRQLERTARSAVGAVMDMASGEEGFELPDGSLPVESPVADDALSDDITEKEVTEASSPLLELEESPEIPAEEVAPVEKNRETK